MTSPMLTTVSSVNSLRLSGDGVHSIQNFPRPPLMSLSNGVSLATPHSREASLSPGRGETKGCSGLLTSVFPSLTDFSHINITVIPQGSALRRKVGGAFRLALGSASLTNNPQISYRAHSQSYISPVSCVHQESIENSDPGFLTLVLDKRNSQRLDCAQSPGKEEDTQGFRGMKCFGSQVTCVISMHTSLAITNLLMSSNHKGP